MDRGKPPGQRTGPGPLSRAGAVGFPLQPSERGLQSIGTHALARKSSHAASSGAAFCCGTLTALALLISWRPVRCGKEFTWPIPPHDRRISTDSARTRAPTATGSVQRWNTRFAVNSPPRRASERAGGYLACSFADSWTAERCRFPNALHPPFLFAAGYYFAPGSGSGANNW